MIKYLYFGFGKPQIRQPHVMACLVSLTSQGEDKMEGKKPKNAEASLALLLLEQIHFMPSLIFLRMMFPVTSPLLSRPHLLRFNHLSALLH